MNKPVSRPNTGQEVTRMALRIPDEHVSEIMKLCTLPLSSVEDLLTALSSAKLTSNSKEMAQQIQGQVPGVTVDDLASMLRTLLTLYGIREASRVRPSRFLDDLIDGIRKLKDSEMALQKEDVSRLRQTFKRLLDIRTLNVLSKAAELQRDCERLYCTAKILSDIRPVFSDDTVARPIASVVTHTLKISYHDVDLIDHKEFFVVLDSGGLKELRRVLDRAQAKDDSLRAFLKESNVPDLGL